MKQLLSRVSVHALAWILVMGGVCQAQPGQIDSPSALGPAAKLPPNLEEIGRVLQTEMQAQHIPGAAIAVVKESGVIYAKGFGVESSESDRPITPDTLFRIASLTKMFTAAAVVSLKEEGKIGLDQPVGKYVQGLSPKIGALTLHQLLTHTSGLSDDQSIDGAHDEGELGRRMRGLDDDVAFLPAGKYFSYSGLGYQLVGLAIEAASGKNYADYVSEKIFQPLGMTRTTFRPTIAMTYPLAQGHQKATDGFLAVVRPYPDNAGRWPSTAIMSSVSDLARFAIAFMADGKLDGTQVVLSTVTKQLPLPYVDAPGMGEGAHYGYGQAIQNYRGVRVILHSGSTPGFGSSIWMMPEQKVAIVILGNLTAAQFTKSFEKATELLMRLEPPAGKEQPHQVPMTEAEMEMIAGSYANPYLGAIHLCVRDHRLFFERVGFDLRFSVGSESPVAKLSENNFEVGLPSGAPQHFWLIESGKSEPMLLNMGVRIFKKGTALKIH